MGIRKAPAVSKHRETRSGTQPCERLPPLRNREKSGESPERACPRFSSAREKGICHGRARRLREDEMELLGLGRSAPPLRWADLQERRSRRTAYRAPHQRRFAPSLP